MGLTPYSLTFLRKAIPAPIPLAVHQSCPWLPSSPQEPLSWQSYLHLLQYRMVLNAREQHSHGISTVVKEWYASTIQVAGQLMDVRL